MLVFQSKISEFGTLKLREFSDADVDGSTLLVGFPSDNFTAIIAANFMVDALKLPMASFPKEREREREREEE